MLDKIDSHPQVVPALGSDSIVSLMQDKESNLWVGTETSGLEILRHQNFRTIPALSDHPVTAIAQATDGAIWVGSNSDGLDRWQAGDIQHLDTRTGLLSETILALASGESGSIWVGTPDGLNYVEGRKTRTYTSADGLPDDLIRSLLRDDDGSLWIGTRRGLAHWHHNQFITLTQSDGLGSDLVGALLRSHASNHDLWIGTLDGLSRLRGDTITTFKKEMGSLATPSPLSPKIRMAHYGSGRKGLASPHYPPPASHRCVETTYPRQSTPYSRTTVETFGYAQVEVSPASLLQRLSNADHLPLATLIQSLMAAPMECPPKRL
ncbi:two-component regulator propeller domain-containing protein [Tunturiibacter gelidiferens]